MALFPAYMPSSGTNDETKKKEFMSWQQNKSCPPEIPVVSSSLLDVQSSDSLNPASANDHRKNDQNVTEDKSFDKRLKTERKKQERLCESESSVEENQSDDSSSHKRKSRKKHHERRKKRSSSESSKKSRKLKSDKKSCEKESGKTRKDEKQAKGSIKDDKGLQIPTHNGGNKNIFLEAHLHFFLPENLGKVLYYDTIPDKNNSIFCNTHYTQVANYSRLSSRPLGLDAFLAFANKRKKKKDRRYFSKSSRLLSDPSPVIKLSKEISVEYVPLKLTYEEEKEIKKSKSTSAMKSLDILDAATEDYLLGRGKTSIDETDSAEGNNLERKYWQDQIKSYNERLARDPRNVALWLEFVDIQDRAISHILETDDQKGDVKGKSYKILVERKISVLETAIAKNVRSLELYLKRLRLGENIWDNKKLRLEWDKLVSNFPNDLSMWYQYLIFHQTYFSTFHLERVVQAFIKCSERLRQMQQGTFLSHKPPENIGYALIDLATQLALIWYQGGYMERAIALFQALIELNLFCPLQLGGDSIGEASKLALFEAFWDSKAPRFGEKDSLGWAKVMEKREPVTFPEEILEGTHDEEDEILTKGGSRHDLWIQLESSRELNHWLPWQQDPENCEDVERMVSFSTLKRHLFFTTSEAESFYLIVQFLTFLGVPVPDRILANSFPSSEACVFIPLRLETLKTLIPTQDFSGESLFQFPVIGPSILESTCESYFSFVCEIISRSMSVIPVSAKPKLGRIFVRLLSERSLVLRQSGQDASSSTIRSYKKKIKNLLKEEFRSDLEIYYEFGRFESSLQCYEEAFKIHSMALTLGLQGNVDSLLSDVTGVVLWEHLSALVHLHLEKEEKISQDVVNKVLNTICSVILEGKVESSQACPNGLQILRVKKKLASFVEMESKELFEVDRVKVKVLNSSVKLLSVCQLLTVGFKPACLVFEEFIDKMGKPERAFCHELEGSKKHPQFVKAFSKTVKEDIYEDYLWLISVAPKLTPIPCLPLSVSSVRQILKSAIAVAPSKVTFLQKLAEYQNWRDILRGHNFHEEGSAGILVIIFRLLPHIKKATKMLSSAEFGVVSAGYQLESILEAAVSSPSGSNCPLLWRLYLRLIQTTRPTRLKQIAYRALNSCPNAKCLYMDFIKFVPEALPDVLKLMGEKGIRVRLPLEELDVLLEEEKVDEDYNNLEDEKQKRSMTEPLEDKSSSCFDALWPTNSEAIPK